MSDNEQNLISVKILDRSYKIKCLPEHVSALQEAASAVEEQMRKAKHGNQINTTEQIAVLTALNVCYELMQLRKQKNNYIDIMNQRIQDLQRRIENFLAVGGEITV